jgi:hypothetical protein
MDDVASKDRAAAEKVIRDEIETLLQSHDIYPLGNYGWSGPDDYDEDMVGHAMWQTHSLYGRFPDAHFSATHNNAPPPRGLEPWEQFLVGSGGDFEGLMEAARLSIGLVLFFRATKDRGLYDESSLFQVHLMSSMLLLSTAADRLRDLFIASVFQANTEEYQLARRGNRKARRYNAPFEEAALAIAGSARQSASYEHLKTQANLMQAFRQSRNSVVHVVRVSGDPQYRRACRHRSPWYSTVTELR